MSIAVVYDRYGPPEVLTVTELPVGPPGPGEVLVRYSAIGVNPVDWKILRGDLSSYFPLRPPAILGVEAAGVVVATGSGVSRFAVGDRVIRHGPPGTFREEELVPASVEADQLTPQPQRFGFEQAAVLPVAAGTGYSALRQVAFRSGERLLILGASGGVGLATVQLARILGAGLIIGTASPAHHELVRSLGAVPVPYGPGLEASLRELGPVDAVVDCAGGEQSREVTAAAVADPQRRVTIVADPLGDQVGIPFLGHQPNELAATLDLIGQHPFDLPIRARFPLTSAVAAVNHSKAGHLGGKVILVPNGSPSDRQ